MKITVGVLTCLGNEKFGTAHPDIAADGFQDAAYGDGGMEVVVVFPWVPATATGVL